MIEDLVEDDRAGVAVEGQMSRGHLIQHAADGEQICPHVECFATRLLGRHIRDGSDSGTGTGEMFGRADRLRAA